MSPAIRPSKMTLEELDQQLDRWQKSVAAVIANVYELYEHPVYRVLAGSSSVPKAPLTGESRPRVDAALDAVGELLRCGSEIHAVVERAAEWRQAMPLLFREERIREIGRLLDGPSIRLPAADIPLMQRGLLTAAVGEEREVSIRQMLDVMTPTFEVAKRTIAEVEQAWATLYPLLDKAAAETNDLRRMSEEAGLGDESDWPAIERGIASARATVKLDPLGATGSVMQGIIPALARVRIRLEENAAEQRRATADLAEARQLQSALVEVHAHALTICAERQLKVALPESLAPADPLTAGQIKGCRNWLQRLDSMMADAAARRSAGIEVRRWLETARGHLAHEQAAGRAHQALLDERIELRGRLDALAAKAAGCALAEDAELAADAQAARSLLYRRPTPLIEARALVARYQARLNDKIASSARR